jgi:hypothetical protein
MAGDYQPSKKAQPPPSIKERGAYVALSDDDGETWRIKRLPGAYSAHRKMPSVGYCVARQAPNGQIHLVTTLNGPALHFELNEAWVLSEQTYADTDPAMDGNSAAEVAKVTEHRETYADGHVKTLWHTGRANDGRVLLEGSEQWFYADGTCQREAQYHLGVLVGDETFWNPDGKVAWKWVHRTNGVSHWTTYWPDGTKRSESDWSRHALVPGTDQFYAR